MSTPNNSYRQAAAESYYVAALYADKILGPDAGRHYEKLHLLARSHDVPSLKRIVDTWAPAPVAPAFTLPEPERWVPCAHHGLSPDRPYRLCDTCLRQRGEVRRATVAAQQMADILPELKPAARNMARTEAMIKEGFRSFVWQMLQEELKEYTDGYENLFAEIEDEVWKRVGAKIETYRGEIGHGRKPLSAWLGKLVSSVVRDHFRQTTKSQIEEWFDDSHQDLEDFALECSDDADKAIEHVRKNVIVYRVDATGNRTYGADL